MKGKISSERVGVPWLLLVASFMVGFKIASASIHYYNNEGFNPQSNAFFFHGGSEGLYASSPAPRGGKSFISEDAVTVTAVKNTVLSKALTFWSVTVTAVKNTVSRLLLLVVSMGYGVMRPTLGGVTSKVLLLGGMYFIALEALELFEHLGNVNDFSGKAKLYLVLPVAFLDACFILWIFSSLSKTLERLQMRKSMAKLELYRKFTNSLAIFVLLSIAWVGFELYFNASDPMNGYWRIAWIIPAFWSALAFCLLAVMCILWAPSNNPTRYAYTGEIGEELDEDALPLTSSGVRVVSESGTSILDQRKETKGSAASSAADTVSRLLREEEDLEEDKRE